MMSERIVNLLSVSLQSIHGLIAIFKLQLRSSSDKSQQPLLFNQASNPLHQIVLTHTNQSCVKVCYLFPEKLMKLLKNAHVKQN